jgi:hypothetical protein
MNFITENSFSGLTLPKAKTSDLFQSLVSVPRRKISAKLASKTYRQDTHAHRNRYYDNNDFGY